MGSVTTDDEEPSCFLDTDAQKLHVLHILKYQKSLYYSSSSSLNSSSFASTTASCSSYSSTSCTCRCGRGQTSLLDLLKEGSTCLGRLFAIEHTSLKTHLRDYSASPVVKPIFLWGTDTDDSLHDDPWNLLPIMQEGRGRRPTLDNDGQSDFNLDLHLDSQNNLNHSCPKRCNPRLIRARKFRSFSTFHLLKQNHGRLRIRLRLKRLRILGVCCTKLIPKTCHDTKL